MGIHRIDCRGHFVLYNINDMDALLLFVMLPLLGYGLYWLMKNDIVQSIIGNIKKRIGEKKDV